MATLPLGLACVAAATRKSGHDVVMVDLYPHRVDEEMVVLMRKAGCEQVSIRIESGSERTVKGMNKGFTPKGVNQISKMLADQGIRRTGFLLLGSPGENRESVEESLVFAESLKLESMRITLGIRIYPHTSLAKTAVDEGMISSGDDLLLTKCHLARGLEDWLPRTLQKWTATRPHWIP